MGDATRSCCDALRDAEVACGRDARRSSVVRDAMAARRDGVVCVRSAAPRFFKYAKLERIKSADRAPKTYPLRDLLLLFSRGPVGGSYNCQSTSANHGFWGESYSLSSGQTNTERNFIRGGQHRATDTYLTLTAE